ncbi:MAG: SDR family oxidoreductase [Cryomorphaceae bacterium]|nr:SDR family oxidoreductase [Cryomorphaceae bacterium]
MNWNLSNKTALVCGSTSGIGKAIAQAFATSGASVILMARNEEKLRETLDALPTGSGQIHQMIKADFSQPQAPKKALDQWLQSNPNEHIDILVNNTGGPPPGPAHLAKVEEYLNAFNTHLINNHELVQCCLPGMKANGGGRIINVISTSVKIPLNGLGVSNTVRGAVGNWAKTLANELGAFNITVNNILPGATATDRLKGIIDKKSEKSGESKEIVTEKMLSEIPMKRFAEPEEVAAAAGFLASEAASYINGINIPVDGGRTGNL